MCFDKHSIQNDVCSHVYKPYTREVMDFDHLYIIDITSYGDRVEMNGNVIQYYDKDGDIIFQGVCQYDNPIDVLKKDANAVMNFKLVHGWVYWKDLGTPICFIYTPSDNTDAITIGKLSEIDHKCGDSGDCISINVYETEKEIKDTVVSAYDRNGKFVYTTHTFTKNLFEE